MTEIATSLRTSRSPLRRWWAWVLIVVVAVGAGALSYAAGGSELQTTTAVINTRSAASLPNDRLDIISDLAAATKLDSVLSGPAHDAGVSVSDLKGAVTVSEISGSTLATMSIDSPLTSSTARRDLLTAILQSAISFLNTSPAQAQQPAQLTAAQDRVDQADQAVSQDILGNGGLAPDREFAGLQSKLAFQTLSGKGSRSATRELRGQVRAFVPVLQDYQSDLNEQTQARSALNALQAQLSRQAGSQATLSNLTLTFEQNDEQSAAAQPDVRRTVASALAGGVLAAVVILGVGALVRRRRHTVG